MREETLIGVDRATQSTVGLQSIPLSVATQAHLSRWTSVLCAHLTVPADAFIKSAITLSSNVEFQLDLEAFEQSVGGR